MARPSSARNLRVVLLLGGLVAGMTGLVAASVPLYQLFCQVTGYGGTTQRAAEASAIVADRTMTVRFNADVNGGLPWSFQPAQREMRLAIGETGLAFYRARNLSARAITGTATFNVTPDKAGRYFSKIDCFCFTEQRLGPGATADMPVTFFVDPALLDDPNMADVRTITLSYTFFRSPDEATGDDRPSARLSSAAGAGAGAPVN
ncbi:MAG: cytochrome c oxidase assembly protein [Dongiaceae bacterium]